MRHNVNIDFLRARFERVNGYYGKRHGRSVSSSIIRIEETLINGQGTYKINLKKEILKRWEQNMLRNDLFVVTHLGVFLSIQDNQRDGSHSLLTYSARPQGDSQNLGFNNQDANALYNGTLRMQTGNIVNLANYPLSVFKKVPAIQPTNELDQREFDLQEMCQPMAEEIVFAGTQDHDITIDFPTHPSSNFNVGGDNIESKLVFIALGYRVNGGTADNFKMDPANPFAAAI